MLMKKLRTASAVLVQAATLVAALCATPAHALPSYARQTGMDCAGCHIGSFGPQLTPAGVRFKLSGYTDSDGQPGKVPLSGMVRASLTHESDPDVAKKDHSQLDEASVFLAGKLTEHIGAFVQVTRDGLAHSTSLDHADVRYARTIDLGGKESLIGVSVNNNPGVQDPFNTLPVWGYPFVSPPRGVATGDAATLINGGLEHRVLGASAYTLYDKSVYAELGSYRSLSPTAQSKLGQGRDQQQLGGNAYWRLAWMQDQKSQAFHVGLFGWNAALTPDRSAGGPSNKYRDMGVDGSYQFLGTREHMATVNASYVGERLTDGTTGELTRLHETRLNASYNFKQSWGGSIGTFATRGTGTDATTSGHLFQADWTPWGKENLSTPQPWDWANLRLGAQYWVYDKFAGDATAGKNPKDHNMLYIFAWTSF
jgi:hypothetical protein